MSPAPAIRVGGGGGSQWGPMVSGATYFSSQAANSTQTQGDGTLRAHSSWWPGGSIATVNAEISTAGNASSVVRLGLYYDNGAGAPGNLLFDFGTINGATTTPTAITGPWVIPYSGVWWWAACSQNAATTQPTMRIVTTLGSTIPVPVVLSGSPTAGAASSNCWTMPGVTGALPSTFTLAAVGGSCSRLLIKAT